MDSPREKLLYEGGCGTPPLCRLLLVAPPITRLPTGVLNDRCSGNNSHTRLWLRPFVGGRWSGTKRESSRKLGITFAVASLAVSCISLELSLAGWEGAWKE